MKKQRRWKYLAYGLSMALAVGTMIPAAGVSAAPTVMETAADENLLQAEKITTADIPATDPAKGLYAPITGYYERELTVGEKSRNVKFYVPETAKMGTYGVMINVPEGENTEEFLQESGWMDLADAEAFVLFVLEPENGAAYGTAEEERAYVSAVYKEMASGTFVKLNSATFYIVGYGSEGSYMQEFAMATPLTIGAAAFIDGNDISGEYLEEMAAAKADAKTEVVKSQVPTPVWIIESEADEDTRAVLEYWKNANYCGENGKKFGLGGTVYTQQSGTEFTAGEEICQVIYQEKDVDMNDPYLTSAIYNQFLSKYLCYGSVATGWLTGERADYDELNVITKEFVQNYEGQELSREYMLYIPDSVKNAEEGTVPVLLSAPGAGSSDQFMFDTSMWWEKAEEEGFILAVVSAVPGSSSSSAIGSIGWDTSTQKDIQYVEQVVDQIVSDYDIADSERVYFNGQSQGCVFACHVGTCLPETFAAVAATSCARYYPEITDQIAIPYYTLFGEFDNFKNWGAEDWDLSKEGAVRSQMNYWITINQTTDIDHPSKTWQEGRFTTDVWDNQQGIPMVQMTKTEGRGHCTVKEETDLMWDYLEQFAAVHDKNGNLTKRLYSKSGFNKNDTVVIGEKQEQTITSAESCVKTITDKSFKLNAKTSGDGSLTYKSSNPSVATVNKNGKVTLLGTGKAVITISASETNQYKVAVKKITVKVVPGKASIKKVSSSAKKTVDVQVKKDEKASGYEIQISSDKKFAGKCITVKLEGNKNTEMQIKNAGLKSGTKYYVRVRSYKTISSEPCYGAYSSTVKVNVK